MLEDIVEKIRSREWTINMATRTAGLRDKLTELLIVDNDTDYLENILETVESRLLTESYVLGASTDNPLNKRRDELIKWKSRLKQDIQK